MRAEDIFLKWTINHNIQASHEDPRATELALTQALFSALSYSMFTLLKYNQHKVITDKEIVQGQFFYLRSPTLA